MKHEFLKRGRLLADIDDPAFYGFYGKLTERLSKRISNFPKQPLPIGDGWGGHYLPVCSIVFDHHFYRGLNGLLLFRNDQRLLGEISRILPCYMFYDSRRTWFWVEEIEDKHLLDDTSELVFLPDDVNLPVVFKGWGVREHCKLDPTGEAVEYDPDLPPERSNKEYWGPVTVPKRFYEPVARSALGNLIVAELRKAGFHLPKHDFCHSGTASDFVWNYMHEGQNSVACGILSRHRWKLLTEKKVAVWYEGFNREHISCSPFTRRLRPNVYFLQWPEKRWLMVRPYHETLAGDAIFVDLEAGRSD